MTGTSLLFTTAPLSGQTWPVTEFEVVKVAAVAKLQTWATLMRLISESGVNDPELTKIF